MDRASRRVFIRIYKSKTTAANARLFLRDLERARAFFLDTLDGTLLSGR